MSCKSLYAIYTLLVHTYIICLNFVKLFYRDVNSREILFPSLGRPIPGLDRDSIWTEYLHMRSQSDGITSGGRQQPWPDTLIRSFVLALTMYNSVLFTRAWLRIHSFIFFAVYRLLMNGEL